MEDLESDLKSGMSSLYLGEKPLCRSMCYDGVGKQKHSQRQHHAFCPVPEKFQEVLQSSGRADPAGAGLIK